MGQDTEKLLAIKFPNSYHLFPRFEEVCTTAKEKVDKGDKVRICFDVLPAIDKGGRIIVKCFESMIKTFQNLDV